MKAQFQAVHPVLAASDLAASIEFYRDLGFTLTFQDEPDEPKYAAMTRDRVELHIQWADPEQWAYPTDRPVLRFLVSDVDALHEELVAGGRIHAETSSGSPWAAPGNTPWGTREFHLRDPSRNGLQFYRPL